MAEINHLQSQGFYVPHLANNDVLPVGGNLFSDAASMHLVADIDKFSDFYRKVDKYAEKLEESKFQMGEWLRNCSKNGAADIDVNTFLSTYAFTKVYEKEFPAEKRAQSASIAREKLYKGGSANLSDVMAVDAQECAEISALAQGYLQRKNLGSTLVSGAVMWNKEQEFPEPHVFLLLNSADNKQFIYDPTNPCNTDQGAMPSLCSVKGDFLEAVRNHAQRMIEVEDILSKKKRYYGISRPGTNVFPESIVENAYPANVSAIQDSSAKAK